MNSGNDPITPQCRIDGDTDSYRRPLSSSTKQKSNDSQVHNVQEDAEPDQLLKEYELCWEGVVHNNTRMWMSAAVFITGGIAGLAWLGTRPLATNNWAEFWLVTVGALFIALIIRAYLRILRSWELLDRVDFYRAEEIERHLGLWRIRYRVRAHEHPTSEEQDSERLDRMRQAISTRLGVKVQKLPDRAGANKALRFIIRLIIAASSVYIARALIITLGLLQ